MNCGAPKISDVVPPASSSTADRTSQTSSIEHVEFADAKNIARAHQLKKERDFSRPTVSRLVLLEFLG
jgi:hypothetical protein